MSARNVMWNRPTFLVIGAAKCASTSMCTLLATHPDVFMCQPKEPRFFSLDDNYARGWRWYGPLFAAADGQRAIGEGSVCYGNPLRHPEVVTRIARDLEDVRFVYMVRHPLARIESDWKMRRHQRSASCCDTLSDTVERHPEILEHSRYWEQLDRYLQVFSAEQIRLVFFEDFVRDPRQQIGEVLRHIGVSPSLPDDVRPEQAFNSSDDYRDDVAMARWLRRVPGARALAAAAPTGVTDVLREHLRPKVAFDATWTAEARERVSAELRPGAERLLAYAGKPASYWAWE